MYRDDRGRDRRRRDSSEDSRDASRRRYRKDSRSPDRSRRRRSYSRSPDDKNRRRDESRDRKNRDERRRHRSDSYEEEKKSKSSHKKSKKNKKSKKKKKKRSSSSSDSDSESSGADSDSSTELLIRLEKERKELKKKRKAEKEKIKATETLEEKRERRIMKRELKAMTRREKMGLPPVVHEGEFKYTNDDNPFGDPMLEQRFKWGAKLKKEGLDKLDDKQLDRMQRMKMEEQRLELEKVKMNRIAREKEMEERRHAMELEDRMRENDKFSKFKEQEDEFHLEQARLRSKIRIQDGRAKPIDLLAKYISAEEEMDAIEMHEPYTYLNGLTIDDLEDLVADINVYSNMDLDKNRGYWSDIMTIVEDELNKLRKLESQEESLYEAAAERRQGINKAVADDVQKIFQGKTAEQLSTLQKSIESKLRMAADGSSGVDVNYWESLLSQLKAHLARARLRDKHKENLKKKLELLKAEQNQEENDDGDDEDMGEEEKPASTRPTTEDEEEEDDLEAQQRLFFPSEEEKLKNSKMKEMI